MNPIIKEQSLLSSISNISGPFRLNDGSSVFNFSMLPNNYQSNQSQRACEVKFDDIFPHEEHNSILDRIIKKQEIGSSIIQYNPTPILPQVIFPNNSFNEKSWRITQQKGVSEDEGEAQEDEHDSGLEKRLKNQTKNIPKNYGKAIISFMEKYKYVVQRVCNTTGTPFQQFFQQMLQFKKTINTIADLRRVWIEYRYARTMRILSNLFFRKYSLSYIFNSRICNFKSHIKYRHRLSEAIKHPQSFRHIKDY